MSWGPLTVMSGDIFGFYPRSLSYSGRDHVIVYPRVFPISRLAYHRVYPLGDTKAERRAFSEDPSRVVGSP